MVLTGERAYDISARLECKRVLFLSPCLQTGECAIQLECESGPELAAVLASGFASV